MFSWVVLIVLMMMLSCLQAFDFAFLIIMAIMNFRMDQNSTSALSHQESARR
jgi:hypothetical protein